MNIRRIIREEVNDFDWVRDLETRYWDKNKKYVLDVSMLDDEPPQSLVPGNKRYTEIFKSDILDHAEAFGYDISDLHGMNLFDMCYIYFNPITKDPIIEWDVCNLDGDPTYGGSYELIDVDTFMYYVDNKFVI